MLRAQTHLLLCLLCLLTNILTSVEVRKALEATLFEKGNTIGAPLKCSRYVYVLYVCYVHLIVYLPNPDLASSNDMVQEARPRGLVPSTPRRPHGETSVAINHVPIHVHPIRLRPHTQKVAMTLVAPEWQHSLMMHNYSAHLSCMRIPTSAYQ